MKILFLLLLFPFQLFAQGPAVLFENVNVIDVEKGTVLPSQNVLIENNRIKSISSKKIKSKTATIVDATGKYLLPGFCDFNASVLQEESEGAPAFSLMVAWGVTSVRDLLPPYTITEAVKIKKQLSDAELVGPRLYLSGKTLIDRLPFQKENSALSRLVNSPEEATAVVDSMIAAGADVLDIRTILNASILKAITSRAHQKGVKVLARFSGDWMKASQNGVDAFTHLSDLWRVTSIGREKLFYFSAQDSMRYVSVADFYNRVLPSLGEVDKDYLDDLSAVLKKNNTWLCAGFASYKPSLRRFEQGDTTRNVYRTAKQKEQMKNDAKEANALTNPSTMGTAIDMKPVLRAVRNGVRLLSGTQMDGYITAGLSLHDVFVYLVEGGFTPAEVLRSATINPAIFLGKQKSIGTIKEGKLADLVLLDANPLQDINNTRKINAVVLNGKLLQRADLDKLLQEAVKKAAHTYFPRSQL